MIDDVFVIDTVAHAYNQTPANFADPTGAGAITELAYALSTGCPDPRYELPKSVYLSDWQVPDLARVLFGESQTDVAIMHPLAISAFKDGYVSLSKAAEAIETYPNRFIGANACVDPLTGPAALESLDRQADMLRPMGLKLYPTSWDGSTPVSWRMDDPTLIYRCTRRLRSSGFGTSRSTRPCRSGPSPSGMPTTPRTWRTPRRSSPT